MNRDSREPLIAPCRVPCVRNIAKGDHEITVSMQFTKMNSKEEYDFAKIQFLYESEVFVRIHSSVSRIYVDESESQCVPMQLRGSGFKQTIHAVFTMTKHIERRYRDLYLSCWLTDRFGRSPQHLQYSLLNWEDQPRCEHILPDEELGNITLPWLGLVEPRVHFTKKSGGHYVTGIWIEFRGTAHLLNLTRAYKFGHTNTDHLYLYPEHLEEVLPWDREYSFVAPVHDPRTGAPYIPLLRISNIKLFLPNAVNAVGKLWLEGSSVSQTVSGAELQM